MATTYKIVYENAGALAVEAEFESLRDALKYLGDSKFMRPVVKTMARLMSYAFPRQKRANGQSNYWNGQTVNQPIDPYGCVHRSLGQLPRFGTAMRSNFSLNPDAPRRACGPSVVAPVSLVR